MGIFFISMILSKKRMKKSFLIVSVPYGDLFYFYLERENLIESYN